MSETVLDRLWAGTMLCDGVWPAERLENLQRWSSRAKPHRKH